MVDKIRHAGRWLLPARCRLCAAPLAAPGLCTACHEQLPWNRVHCPQCARPQTHQGRCASCLRHPPAFDAAWTPWRLEAPIQPWIHALKYRGDLGAGRLLASLTAGAVPDRTALADAVLIPVPLHRGRQWRRGYNQAMEIARALAPALGLPLEPLWAQRTRATADQIGSDAATRRRNLRRAFSVSADVRGRHVLLLDDVMTTGATLDALARACRRGGARRVTAWALARVP